MKKLLTLVLCWLLAFSAMAETTFKAKTAASVAGGYVTSLNKVDGSFEDVVTQWVASVGTIVPTASTIMQGEKIGVWSGTGAGTLDLQWTATASNTYEASAQVDVQGEDDVYICAYVGTTETGCKLIPALSKIQKVSVVADSVISSAFYLRLKHTGSDAFNVKVDDGKIEPWTPQAVNLVEQESVSFTGYSSGTNPIVFKTKDTLRSNEKSLIAISTVGSAGTASRYTILKQSIVAASASRDAAGSGDYFIVHYNSSGSIVKRSAPTSASGRVNPSISSFANVGDYFLVFSATTPSDNTDTNFSITASAISDNVVQSYAPSDFLGEIKLLPSTTAPKGFIPADGKSIGKTSGNYQGDAYYALYAIRWAMASTTAGEPYVISSAKGASAQADWDAGKTITIDVRGLFFRAAGGDAGAVGSKQLDAFQGHWHNSYPSSGAANGSSVWSGNGGGSVAVVDNVKEARSDGTNGTPRTASETRPVNTSEYAYMRYGTSAPDLYALPSSKRNEYGAIFDSTPSLVSGTKTGGDWYNSVVNNTTGSYTIDYTKLSLTAIPRLKIEPTSNAFVFISSQTATSATFLFRSDTGVALNSGFDITLFKSGADSTEPGVFVGNVQPEWQYDISSYLTGFTSVSRAVGVVYKTANGAYRMRFSVTGSVNSATRTEYSVAISGVAFKNISNFYQPISFYKNGSTTLYNARVAPNSNELYANFASDANTIFGFSGDVELESKPTWAVNTP